MISRRSSTRPTPVGSTSFNYGTSHWKLGQRSRHSRCSRTLPSGTGSCSPSMTVPMSRCSSVRMCSTSGKAISAVLRPGQSSARRSSLGVPLIALNKPGAPRRTPRSTITAWAPCGRLRPNRAGPRSGPTSSGRWQPRRARQSSHGSPSVGYLQVPASPRW